MRPKLQEWADSDVDHALIVGHPWGPDSVGVRVDCEGCGAPVSLFPACMATLGPQVHALCRVCLGEIRTTQEVVFGGRIDHKQRDTERSGGVLGCPTSPVIFKFEI